MAATMLRKVRPFAGPVAMNAAVPCRVRVLKVQCLRTQQNVAASGIDEAATTGPSASLPVAFSVALGALGLTAHCALADELAASPVASGISAEDLEILAASSAGSGIEQILVSLLFGVVVLLLTIVTGGVAYINIKQFLDGRQEVDDREKALREFKVVSPGRKGKNSDDDDDDDEGDVVPLKRANRIKKEKGKGFAAADFTSRR